MKRSTWLGRIWKVVTAGSMVLGAIACSAGATDDPSDPEVFGEDVSALGASCAGNAPSKTVKGGFSPAWTSEATYGDCYKGKVVQINKYKNEFAVGGYTKVAFGGATPSAADCAGSTVTAYLFSQEGDGWHLSATKEAHGDSLTDDIPSDMEGIPNQLPPKATGPVTSVPKDPGIFGPANPTAPKCRAPVVYFYDWDMRPGGNYLIAASARLPGKVLQPITFESVAGKCGGDGMECCPGDGLACDTPGQELMCDDGTCKKAGIIGGLCWGDGSCNVGQCDTKTNRCAPCGHAGETCCSKDAAGCETGTSCSPSNICKSCGHSGEACCSFGTSCFGELICEANKQCMKPPASTPPSPPSPPGQPSCGGLSGPCCSTGQACSSPYVCLPTINGVNACVVTPLTAKEPFCDAPNESCCPGQGSGTFPYCSQEFFPGLRCVDGLKCGL